LNRLCHRPIQNIALSIFPAIAPLAHPSIFSELKLVSELLL